MTTKFTDWSPTKLEDYDAPLAESSEVDPRVEQQHSIGQLPCPPNPPPPVGWKYWKGDVPASATTFCVGILHDPVHYPMGSFIQAMVHGLGPGEVIGARVEWHDTQGGTGAKGCFRGVNLMRRVV
jgi:hypothetical protein